MARILVIDDDPYMRNLIAETLEATGHEVACAANGADALAMFSTHPAELLITDLLMPERGGVEVIMELLARDANLKIIVMTGAPTEWNMVAVAETVGAQKTLLKPFTLEEMSVAVETLLRPQSP